MEEGILRTATTQYDDLKGTAALDFHGMSEDFTSLANAAGIDTKEYDPVGLSYYKGVRFFSLEIFCTKASENHDKQKTVAFSVNMSEEEFFKHVKRFSVILVEKHNESADYNIVESVSLEK